MHTVLGAGRPSGEIGGAIFAMFAIIFHNWRVPGVGSPHREGHRHRRGARGRPRSPGDMALGRRIRDGVIVVIKK